MSKVKKVGVVGVDSGQVMICDPCYIESEWKADNNGPVVPPEIWRDKKTGKTYAYAGFPLPKGMTADVRFDNWEAPLEDYDGKGANQVMMDGLWEKCEVPEEHSKVGEFSYPGVCHTTNSDDGFGQLMYNMGHAGAGVASCTMIGDGCYPVFARVSDKGAIEGLAIDFRLADYDGEIEAEDVMKILQDPSICNKGGIPKSAEEVKNLMFDRQQVGIWPGMRRLCEGADMIEELLEDLKTPISVEGVEALQKTVVDSAEIAIEQIRNMRAALDELQEQLGEEESDSATDIDHLEPLS
jgi:hypothetical protein